MIIYTPFPEDVLSPSSLTLEFEEVCCGDATLIVETCDHIRYQINRLISTDPQDYLDPGLEPGTEISFSPVIVGPQ